MNNSVSTQSSSLFPANGRCWFNTVLMCSLACMRVIKRSIAVILIVCTSPAVALSLAEASSPFYMEPVGIRITHPYGQKRALISPQFHYSDSVRYYENHFEVVIGTHYKRSFWVHFARIHKAHFHTKKDMTEILIVSDDGKILTGLFPEKEMKISGKGKSGHVSYPISKVKSIEFVKFIDATVEGKTALDRAATSALLQREWEKVKMSPSTWIVTDRGISYENAKLLNIVDCFSTSRIGYIVHSDRTFRRCQEPESNRLLTVKRGSSTVDVFIDELEFIEITGKKVNDGFELIAVRRDDKSRLTGVYPINLDEDDMVVWKTRVGYEGIGILPLRRITIRAHEN